MGNQGENVDVMSWYEFFDLSVQSTFCTLDKGRSVEARRGGVSSQDLFFVHDHLSGCTSPDLLLFVTMDFRSDLDFIGTWKSQSYLVFT